LVRAEAAEILRSELVRDAKQPTSVPASQEEGMICCYSLKLTTKTNKKA
jgi:hypothetical protein